MLQCLLGWSEGACEPWVEMDKRTVSTRVCVQCVFCRCLCLSRERQRLCLMTLRSCQTWLHVVHFHEDASIWTSVQFSSVQSLSRVRVFATPWTAAHQASLSITNFRSLLKPMSTESVMPSKASSVIPFSSHLQSFPASGSFPMSQLFASGGQSIGVSASTSVLPMNTQDWSPLGWTGWISLQSKGLSRVFSNNTVQKHQLFGTQLSL